MPQRSVLGLLLWNTAYDVGTVLPEDVSITCYADDVLRGSEIRGGVLKHLGGILVAFPGIGLRVFLRKREASDFHRSRDPLPQNLVLKLEESEIRGGVLKYLGVTLDSGLSFAQHLATLDSKLRATIASLGRLMPNLRGPEVVTRKLYVTVVHSIALYGAPV